MTDTFEAIRWPDDRKPSRSPIHFTNELEVAVSPETIWSLLTDPDAWPSFYPGVSSLDLLGDHGPLKMGSKFETSLAGQDVWVEVTEFEPTKRIAWTGGPRADRTSIAYHAWIITPTAKGVHLWTEETMQGPTWIEAAKPQPDIFWKTHEKLLTDLARTATERERA